ncbi:MAG: 4-(cytidine 5'-diphospho)-2-C-methyl-D-erythritol kinase [Crocinitomicaceae bacterium]|nr:4-(cytidine 5'-diphospho)-2-C-methyl-D-erythritol kinase [Crocinitomicaceae bacterium]
MILFPPAKINLGLKVLKKRSDGYHEIDTCMMAIPLTDVLEIIPSETFIFKQTGITIDGDQESNLCVKAFRIFQERYDIPNAYIHLRKQLPMGAGLGGGSADASYVLKGLNAIFEKSLTDDQLRDMATELGSDCPFFISDAVQLGRGRGTELSDFDLDLNAYYLKVINPEIHVGTQEAYAGISFSDDSNGVEEVLQRPIANWKELLKNDFEPSIFKRYPVIEELKNQLYAEGAIYASMSGSGSTLYGIFEQKPEITTDYFEKVLEL